MGIRTKELDRLIADYGKPLGLVIGNAGGAYDPATGSTAPVAPTTETFRGYIYNSGKGLENSSNTVHSHKSCLMLGGATATVPTDKHEISYLTNSSEIMMVESIWADDNVVFYLIHLVE
jgi:hypothetical protein